MIFLRGRWNAASCPWIRRCFLFFSPTRSLWKRSSINSFSWRNVSYLRVALRIPSHSKQEINSFKWLSSAKFRSFSQGSIPLRCVWRFLHWIQIQHNVISDKCLWFMFFSSCVVNMNIFPLKVSRGVPAANQSALHAFEGVWGGTWRLSELRPTSPRALPEGAGCPALSA